MEMRLQLIGRIAAIGTLIGTCYSLVLQLAVYHHPLRGLLIGGIHGFMSWKNSVLTDSGGFQIFSLPHSLPAPSTAPA